MTQPILLENARRAVRTQRVLGVTGAVLAALGVGLSAYAAHAGTLDVAGRAALANAAWLGMLHGAAVTALSPQAVVVGERRAVAMLLAGALVFMGSIALHHLGSIQLSVAPAGGIAMMAGWLWLAWARWQRR